MYSKDLLRHYRQLSQRPLTIVDVETTGRYPDQHRMIEIAVVQGTLSGGIQHCQSDLINPDTLIPERISDLTGISQAMVDAAKPASETLPNYKSRLSQGVLTAHNIEFDYPFIRTEFERIGIPFYRSPADQLCTVKLARLMLAELPSRSLPHLVEHFQWSVGRSHRAEADAIACWKLAQLLLKTICDEPDGVILRKFAQEWLPISVITRMFKCSRSKVRSRLEKAGAPHRFSRQQSGGMPLYRRGDVERVMAAYIEEIQLSEGIQLKMF